MKIREIIRRPWRWVTVAAFAAAVFCLWYIWYPHILSAREASVLFIWDWTYVTDRLAMPWGWAGLLWAFVEQWFFDVLLGATLMTLLSLAAMGLTYGLLKWLLCRKQPSGQRQNLAFVASFFPALLVCCLPLHTFGGTEEEMTYDYLLREGDWRTIINKYNQQTPHSMACNSAAALALFQTGQINEQALVHAVPVTRQVMSGRSAAFIMSDIYMATGLVSMAQRSAFEAMESIEDFNKSGRALARLTECALIYGQTEVALKYIALLEKTVFYRRWALRMRQWAEHPERVSLHPTYGRLRELNEKTKDTFFK